PVVDRRRRRRGPHRAAVHRGARTEQPVRLPAATPAGCGRTNVDVILVASVVIAITVAAVLLLRRVLARRGTRQSERAGRAVQFLIGVIGAYYGLLTGFTLSGVWAKAEFVRGAVMVEL